MRLRNITGSRDIIAESDFVIHDETKRKGLWKEIFGNDLPIRLEIGMGKGRFIMDMAEKYLSDCLLYAKAYRKDCKRMKVRGTRAYIHAIGD